MKGKYYLVFGVVALILVLDQVVKIWVKTNFSFFDPSVPLIGNWFQLNYIENQGMAFGTQLGSGMWGKLILSLFRVGAIIGIVIYIIKQIKKGDARKEFLVVIALILAGATGNLIDSMFYDFIFQADFDPCLPYNQMHGSGVLEECVYGSYSETVEVRHRGFLFGNVVDMFQFNVIWPSWVPWLGGSQVFPAIWNVADASISVGVVFILLRQKTYFPSKEEEQKKDKDSSEEEE